MGANQACCDSVSWPRFLRSMFEFDLCHNAGFVGRPLQVLISDFGVQWAQGTGANSTPLLVHLLFCLFVFRGGGCQKGGPFFWHAQTPDSLGWLSCVSPKRLRSASSRPWAGTWIGLPRPPPTTASTRGGPAGTPWGESGGRVSQGRKGDVVLSMFFGCAVRADQTRCVFSSLGSSGGPIVFRPGSIASQGTSAMPGPF